MDIVKLNEEYVSIKKELGVITGELERLEATLTGLADWKIEAQADLIKAKRENDSDKIKHAKDHIEGIDNEIKSKKDMALERKNKLEGLKTRVNEIIGQVKENPQIKQYLNEVMIKKYERKLAKLKTEKDDIVAKKETLQNIQTMISEHPSLNNALKGMAIARKNLKLLTPGDSKEALFKEKYEINKKTIMGYIDKNNINIPESAIEDLIETGFAIDDKGNVDLAKNIKKADREINGLNKSIYNYTKSLDRVYSERQEENQPIKDDTITNSTEQKEDAKIDMPVSTKKPKWYQFIKRFKAWREDRIYNDEIYGIKVTYRRPEEVGKQQEEVESLKEQDETTNSKNSAFTESLKYEVVRDVLEARDKENIKQAKREYKEER